MNRDSVKLARTIDGLFLLNWKAKTSHEMWAHGYQYKMKFGVCIKDAIYVFLT